MTKIKISKRTLSKLKRKILRKEFLKLCEKTGPLPTAMIVPKDFTEEDLKQKRQQEFFEFAKEVGEFPTSVLATSQPPSEGEDKDEQDE